MSNGPASQMARLNAEIHHLRDILSKIQRWQLPETGQVWSDGSGEPMSYRAVHGVDGEREYFRKLAADGLEGK